MSRSRCDARPRTLWAAALGAAAVLSVPSGGIAGTVIDLSSRAVPTLLGSHAEEQFGYSTAAGDVDGDGALELVVGAPGHRTAAGYHVGAVYVFEAGALPQAGSPSRALDAALSTVTGTHEQGRFGAAVAVADLSGDGIADLVVGAPSEGEGGGIGRGRVYVFLSASGRPWPRSAGAADMVISGESAGDGLGSSIAAGDTDGDGRCDLLVSASGSGAPSRPAAGAAYVIDGSSLSASSGRLDVAGVARVRVDGDEPGGLLSGLALADTDGDGAAELVLGAYQHDGPGKDRPDAGRTFVIPAASLAGQRTASAARAATTTVFGRSERGFLGRFISPGDVDGDGLQDLLLSAYAAGGAAKEQNITGEAVVLFGRRGGMDASVDLRTVDVPRFSGASRWDLFGYPVLAADLNGDGTADVIASAQFADAREDARARCGEVYVFWGGLRSVLRAKSGTAERADVRIIGALAQDALGGSLLAERLTGEKGPDLVIGAPDAPVTPDCGERCGKLFVVPGSSLVK